MSLKVPRGFQTFSEDAIVQKNADLRRMYAHQDRLAARNSQDKDNLSVVAKMAIVATAVITLAVFAKPLATFVMGYL